MSPRIATVVALDKATVKDGSVCFVWVKRVNEYDYIYIISAG